MFKKRKRSSSVIEMNQVFVNRLKEKRISGSRRASNVSEVSKISEDEGDKKASSSSSS